jgi:cell division protein FtsL
MLDRMHESEQEERKENLRKRTVKIQKLTTTIAGSISAIAVVATLSLTVNLFFDKSKTFSRSALSKKLIDTELVINSQASAISVLQSEVNKISSSLISLSSLPEGTEWKVETSQISEKVSRIQGKLAALEAALTLDPAKALAIPILRKDLDNTEKNLRAELLQTKSEIDHIYDQNKWFLGLMFTMALSVLGMAVSSFVSRKDS